MTGADVSALLFLKGIYGGKFQSFGRIFANTMFQITYVIQTKPVYRVAARYLVLEGFRANY